MMAVNLEYARPGHPLKADDEVAFFPPVTGAEMRVTPRPEPSARMASGFHTVPHGTATEKQAACCLSEAER